MFNSLIQELPIPLVESLSIIDATKVKTFLECPRRFFYEYLLGWKPDTYKKNHLIFGQALHLAMESLLVEGYSKGAVIIGMLVFEECYREEFPKATDPECFPKTPARALDALMDYIDTYKRDNFRVLHTETAGTILVSEKREVHFKMDLIAENEREEIFFMDWKTGSRLTRSWQDQWLLSIQMNLYNHALHCLFLDRTIYGGIVQGFIFKKTETTLLRVPVRRTLAQLDSWLWNFNKILDQMELCFQDLTRVKPEDSTMMAFPQNPTACSDYYGCPYFEFCANGNQNPCSVCHEVPFGFKVEHWDLRKQEEKAKNVVSL